MIIGEEEICLYDLPEVAAGRGSRGAKDDSLQPVSFHALPVAVGECLVHSFWGISVIDLSPGTGELAASTILQSQGYLGICHSEQQRDFIVEHLKKEILKGMKDPQCRAYTPAYSKHTQEAEAKAKAKPTPKQKAAGENPEAPPAKKPKVAAKPKGKSAATPKAPSASTGGGGGGGLSEALKQMLEAAKEKGQGSA